MSVKILSLLVLVCLLPFGSAFAQIDSAAPDMFFEAGYRYLYGSDLFAMTTYDQGEILYDACGNALTETGSWQQIIAVDENNLIVTGFDGLKGVLASDGTLLVPPLFDFVAVYDPWAIAVSYAEGSENDFDVIDESGAEARYLTCNEVSVYFLKDGCRKEMTDRSGFAGFKAAYGCLNIEDRNGLIHSFDADGTLYYSIAEYTDDFKWVPCNAGVYYDDDEYLVGLCDRDGQPLSEPEYISVCVCPGTDYYIIEDEDCMYGLIASDGDVVLVPQYTDIMTLGYGVYDTCGIFAAINDDEGTVTLIDTVTGNCNIVDITEAYDTVFDGCCLMIMYDDGTCKVIGADGNESVLPEGMDWNSIGHGLFVAYEEQAVAVDRTGATVITGSDIFYTPDGHLVVVVDDGMMVFNPGK